MTSVSIQPKRIAKKSPKVYMEGRNSKSPYRLEDEDEVQGVG